MTFRWKAYLELDGWRKLCVAEFFFAIQNIGTVDDFVSCIDLHN